MLEHFFQPSSIAVVGASRTPGKVGHDTLKNLIDAGFEGPIYPVNPKAGDVLGLKCYADLKAIGQEIDLAVIAIPSKFVPDLIGQCAAVGCSSVIVISAGFQEAGEEGTRLQAELSRRCAEHGVRCNAVCPGALEAPPWAQVPRHRGGGRGGAASGPGWHCASTTIASQGLP